MARTFVELRLLASVKADLRDPEIVAEVERRLMRALAARKPKTDSKPRVAELRGEIDNLTDAIASSTRRASAATRRMGIESLSIALDPPAPTWSCLLYTSRCV